MSNATISTQRIHAETAVTPRASQRPIPREAQADIRPLQRDGLYVRHGAGKAITIAAAVIGTGVGAYLGSRFGATVGGRIGNGIAMGAVSGAIGMLGGTVAVGMTHKDNRRSMLGGMAIGGASMAILVGGYQGSLRGTLIGAAVGTIGALVVTGFAQNCNGKIWEGRQ